MKVALSAILLQLFYKFNIAELIKIDNVYF